MRRLFGWVVLVALLGAAAYLFAPLVARPLVADAVRAVSPFGAEPLEIDVQASAPSLLGGRVDSIHVVGTNLSSARVNIGSLDVTVTGVSVLDRSFGSMTGTLESVVLRRSDGDLRVRQVQLSGSSDAVEATASVDRDATLEIVRRALGDAGLPSSDVELADGRVRLNVLGQKTDLALGAVDGAVTIAGSVAGASPIEVFAPEPGDPWRITGVAVSPGGLEVHAQIDLAAALR